ncbi:hypothetical protein AB0M54_14115 [Actinoplanes sp. NPDC051470]|uniref:hypothetical protein n=1 Tax=Actinoplanes sp. NPDC051470 TaxID=3157224 RepID=UPI00342D9205
MARHSQARSEDSEPERRPGAFRSGVHLPPGAAAILALQRAAGNTAVSRVLGDPTQTMPGAFPEERAPSPVPSLDSLPETEVSEAEIPQPPSPASTRFTDAHTGETPVSSPPTTRPSSRASSDRGEEFHDAVERQPRWWHVPPTKGDYPKTLGAAGAIAFPAQNYGLLPGAPTAPNLSSGATGMAAASSTGDALSEVIKFCQGRGFNTGKFIAGVAITGGLITNSVAQTKGPAGDAARFGGLYAQTAGLAVKIYGEGWQSETGFRMFPDGDWNKAIGAFAAAAAPTLQAYAIKHQRHFEQLVEQGRHKGDIPVSSYAIAAAILSGGTAAGDFSSEFLKMVRDRKVNVPKMVGGLFGAVGAVALTVGVAGNNDTARSVGYGFQTAGLATKSLGESYPWEDKWPRLPQKERPEELEMHDRGART